MMVKFECQYQLIQWSLIIAGDRCEIEKRWIFKAHAAALIGIAIRQ